MENNNVEKISDCAKKLWSLDKYKSWYTQQMFRVFSISEHNYSKHKYMFSEEHLIVL